MKTKIEFIHEQMVEKKSIKDFQRKINYYFLWASMSIGLLVSIPIEILNKSISFESLYFKVCLNGTFFLMIIVATKIFSERLVGRFSNIFLNSLGKKVKRKDIFWCCCNSLITFFVSLNIGFILIKIMDNIAISVFEKQNLAINDLINSGLTVSNGKTSIAGIGFVCLLVFLVIIIYSLLCVTYIIRSGKNP